MSDQDYSQLGEKELELMVLEKDRPDKYEVYLELFRRYSEKRDLENATLSLENLITSFDGKIEKMDALILGLSNDAFCFSDFVTAFSI